MFSTKIVKCFLLSWLDLQVQDGEISWLFVPCLWSALWSILAFVLLALLWLSQVWRSFPLGLWSWPPSFLTFLSLTSCWIWHCHGQCSSTRRGGVDFWVRACCSTEICVRQRAESPWPLTHHCVYMLYVLMSLQQRSFMTTSSGVRGLLGEDAGYWCGQKQGLPVWPDCSVNMDGASVSASVRWSQPCYLFHVGVLMIKQGELRGFMRSGLLPQFGVFPLSTGV